MQIYDLSPEDYLVVKANRLFDGTGLTFKENVSIYIWNGMVQFIEDKKGWSGDRVLRRPGAGKRKCRVIDGDNTTVLPGMIDCHVHLALDGINFQASIKQWKNSLHLRARLQEELNSYLMRGIVAVRDGGDSAGIGLSCRKLINSNEVRGPLITATGQALHKRGKYGSFLGPGIAPENLNKTVEQLAAGGVDQIKVIVSGIVSFQEYGKVGEIQFNLEELREIVRIAEDYGLKVMAHASSDEAVQLCIKARVHSIEHGYFICESSLQAMADQQIAWVPTVIPVVAGYRRALQTGATESAGVIERTYRRQLQMINTAHRLGVKLGVGTDAGASGVRHGASFLQELRLYQAAGLPVSDILKAATSNGASIAGLGDGLGMVQIGKPAYLLVVEGDPLTDLDRLSDIRYLIHPLQGAAVAGTWQSA